jgi:cell division protein FtsZ
MTINLNVAELKELKPRILVVGVGGAGGNAINRMIEGGLQGVEFAAINTDAQDLKSSKAEAKIQLGSNLTKGLGSGAKTDIGQASADESLNEIINFLQGSNMVFITAGMGGGTGTGASHVIARAAKELNILTVGVVTLPFSYEGPSRMRRAIQGLEELKKHVDTNIVIPNQNLFKVANEKTTFEESFDLSNKILQQGVQSVTDLMVRPGLINLDFADVETVMSGMGKAMMGTGEAEGEKRAIEAAETALKNPLIDEYSLKGAKGLLINITGGKDLTLFEVDEAVNKVRAEVDPEAELIIGAITDHEMQGQMRVSIVATALDNQGPQTKPVVSMIHRIQNRNNGYSNNTTNTLQTNQNILHATQGATALDLSPHVEENKIIEETKITEESKTVESNELMAGNISMENASYLQATKENDDNFRKDNLNQDSSTPTFEVDSIELATPELFSQELNDNSETNSNNGLKEEVMLFDNASAEENHVEESKEKEPEMFYETDLDDDFEIPAFLRRQKN